jgi:ABC-type amino acid transport substrate-binding protein
MSGKADAMLDDQPVGEKIVAQHPELQIILPPVVVDSLALIGPLGSPLIPELNQFYKDSVASGLYDELLQRWIKTLEPASIYVIGDVS